MILVFSSTSHLLCTSKWLIPRSLAWCGIHAICKQLPLSSSLSFVSEDFLGHTLFLINIMSDKRNVEDSNYITEALHIKITISLANKVSRQEPRYIMFKEAISKYCGTNKNVDCLIYQAKNELSDLDFFCSHSLLCTIVLLNFIFFMKLRKEFQGDCSNLNSASHCFLGK